jgi:hypothetical protein
MPVRSGEYGVKAVGYFFEADMRGSPPRDAAREGRPRYLNETRALGPLQPPRSGQPKNPKPSPSGVGGDAVCVRVRNHGRRVGRREIEPDPTEHA